MTSQYVVFQYLPDPITDERINFGVAAVGSDGFHTRFLRKWGRVTSFGGTDIGFLREFARSVEIAAQPSLLTNIEDEMRALLEEAPRTWINSIQVTPPRASTKPANELVEDVARRFLRTTSRGRRGRDRRWVRAVAYETVVNALEVAGVDDADELVSTTEPIEGDVEKHQFDVAARRNGGFVEAALALSFERQNPQTLQRDYGAVAWALEDVRKREPDLSLSVLMVPPIKGTSKTYEQARYVFDRLGAELFTENEIDQWANDVASRFDRNGTLVP